MLYFGLLCRAEAEAIRFSPAGVGEPAPVTDSQPILPGMAFCGRARLFDA
jgi:hypothetical protein